MLRNLSSEDQTYLADGYSSPYIPVPRKDEMSEAHVEDYLDHFCVPLVGKVSYEERAKMREELRSQIESVIAAYVELGSTREQAVALALQQFSHVPSVPPLPQRNPVVVYPAEAAPITMKRRRTAIKAFGSATVLSFFSVFALSDAHGMEPILMVILAGLPFAAGLTLGYRQPDRPMRSMLKAVGSLILPTLIATWIFGGGSGASHPLADAVAATTCYLAGACLFGGIGTKVGIWTRVSGFLDKVDPPYPARLNGGPYRLP